MRFATTSLIPSCLCYAFVVFARIVTLRPKGQGRQMVEQRRRTLVDKFQRKLAVRMFAYWFLYQFTLFNLLFCWRLLSEGPGDLLQQYGRFFLEYWPVLFGFLAIVPVLIWDAVKFSHRVSGPLVRFRRVCRDIANGQPTQLIQLRPADELLDLQTDFNAMLEQLAKEHAIRLREPRESASQNPSVPASLADQPDPQYA